jgi:hypothetical protein
MRVFHDRLTTEKDREFIKELLGTFIVKFTKTELQETLNIERIIFADFL